MNLIECFETCYEIYSYRIFVELFPSFYASELNKYKVIIIIREYIYFIEYKKHLKTISKINNIYRLIIDVNLFLS
jgi:hypothetical protein